MIFTNAPAVTPVAGPNGHEAFIFHYDFDTGAPTIFARTPDDPQSPMEFMTGTPFGLSTTLTSFRRHGGKLIAYDSVNDGIFSGVDLVNYFDELKYAMWDADDFARLFLIPNMAHCGGGPATNSFNTNLLNAISGWVEHERVIAVSGHCTVRSPSFTEFSNWRHPADLCLSAANPLQGNGIHQ